MRPLTPREKEILNLIVRTDGVVSSASRVAHYFDISEHTARTHLQNIIRKQQSHNLLQATLTYINYGEMTTHDSTQRDSRDVPAGTPAA